MYYSLDQKNTTVTNGCCDEDISFFFIVNVGIRHLTDFKKITSFFDL